MQLQTQLLNLALYKLSLDVQDPVGLRLSLAGTSNDESFEGTRRRQTLWDGSSCDQLILWDDRGLEIPCKTWLDYRNGQPGWLRTFRHCSIGKGLLAFADQLPVEVWDPRSPLGGGGRTDWILHAHHSQAMVTQAVSRGSYLQLRCKVPTTVRRVEKRRLAWF